MDHSDPYIKPPVLLRHVVNPIVIRLGLTTTLLVRGRRSGREIAVPMGAPLELEGQRYLVSGRGATHWVRNLRADAACGLRRHAQTERLRAVEVAGSERDRVLAAYRAQHGHSVDPYFTRIPVAADHPVFRLEAIAAPDQPVAIS